MGLCMNHDKSQEVPMIRHQQSIIKPRNGSVRHFIRENGGTRTLEIGTLAAEPLKEPFKKGTYPINTHYIIRCIWG